MNGYGLVGYVINEIAPSLRVDSANFLFVWYCSLFLLLKFIGAL